jgi:hypothetical protein
MIASLLRRQHQVIIAAIKAGRIDDLARHTDKEDVDILVSLSIPPPSKPIERKPTPPPRPPEEKIAKKSTTGSVIRESKIASTRTTGPLLKKEVRQEPPPAPPQVESQPVPPAPAAGAIGLNLDQVISDYLKRSAEQGRLDLKVLAPNVFTAGKTTGLKVQVVRGDSPEPDAVVTVKIIGTAFKPQVHIARADLNGVASFNLTLPSFTAGTAAIVIEAQSSRGRGELKHLIRKA